jgi:dynein heavy chain
MELKRNFVKNLQNIKNLNYDILDVKITKWHDDYGQYFKDQCKSLEIMYQNIIVLAFKNVSNISDAVEMLENFDSLAKRPLVIDYVHKKAADMVYKLFLTEIREVEETFESKDKRPPPMPFSHPKWAGLAIWAYSLIVRIDKAKAALENLYFIPENQTQKDAIEKYTKLGDQLDSAINTTYFQSWKNDIAHMDSVNIDTKLEVPVLVRSESKEEELPVAVANNPLF